MYYFIPSWYGGRDPFRVQIPEWFRVAEQMTADDTVNQLAMFRASGEQVAVLLFAYHPQLRYTLHKQGLLGVGYWSFFDDIQNIHRKDTRLVSFKELDWPEGIRFVYTPFKVLAMLGTIRYADIHFAEAGNLLSIVFFRSDQPIKWFYFDDRGFLSSIDYLREGEVWCRSYLNEYGVWQVREYREGDGVRLVINPQADHSFAQSSYASWDDLLTERLHLLKSRYMRPSDHVVVAVDALHLRRVVDNFSSYPMVASFFGTRYDLTEGEDLSALVTQARLLVVDSEQVGEELGRVADQLGLVGKEMLCVTPFDTRLRLGQSQSVKELILYLLVDGLEETTLTELLDLFLQMMEDNRLIQLHLVSYDQHRSWEGTRSYLEEQIAANYTPSRFLEASVAAGENGLEDSEDLELVAVRFLTLTSESQVIQALDTVRLIVDWSAAPHLYTQIAGISAGIPQVNRVATQYISHQENGWIAEDPADLQVAVTYYFEGLSNWNRSLVYAVQKMTDYTSGSLLTKWKEKLEQTT